MKNPPLPMFIRTLQCAGASAILFLKALTIIILFPLLVCIWLIEDFVNKKEQNNER